MINLIDLPYTADRLSPAISERTVMLHYNKHHRAYVDKTNELIIGTIYQEMELENIIKETYQQKEQYILYNNAGQVYNHNIYWQSYDIFNKLESTTKEQILMQFGGLEDLKQKLISEAMGIIGSGWVWLVRNNAGRFIIEHTYNGDTPLARGLEPIFNIDVWEHAYYLDYQNERKKYVTNFINDVLKI